jgi:hypothetical protein
MNKYYIIVSILLILTACISEIDVPTNQKTDVPVLNALFSDGDAMKLYLFNIDTTGIIIDLYENDIYIESLSNSDEDLFISEYKLNAGNLYSLIVIDQDGNKIISVDDSIPIPVEITDIDFILDSKYMIIGGQEGDAGTVNIEFNDPENTKNYYELMVYIIEYNKTDPNTNEVYDSILFLKSISTENPILSAEGSIYSGNKSFLFSDNLFNGQQISFDIDYFTGCIACGYKHVVVLRSVSFDYYTYMKSLLLYYNATNLAEFVSITDLSSFIFETEPVNLYSNIENGLGIFAAYSENNFEYSIDRE